jgi:hypothetical protein
VTLHSAPGAGVGLPAGVGGHYRLDVDPDRLSAAAQGLAAMADHLAQQSTQITHAAQIPPTMWVGKARDVVCTETTGLAGQTNRFAGHFHTAATTLTGLATACREAQAQVAALNRGWQAAQDTYEADLKTLRARQDQQTAGLDPAMDPTARKLTLADLTDSYTQARTDTGLTRDTTVRRLDGDYQQLVDGLRAKFRQASAALAAATIVAVPDTTVSGFLTGGGTGMMPSWCTRDGGIFPPDLHAELALEASLPMLHQRDTAADVTRVQPYLQQWVKHPGPIDPQIAAILARRADDPAFAAPIAKALGPDGMTRAIHGVAGLPWQSAAEHEQVQAVQDQTATTLARLLGTASRQPGGLPPGFATQVVSDPQAVAVLFSYADRAHARYGGDFMHEAAVAVVQRDARDPAIWQAVTGPPTFTFGTGFDARTAHDPVLAFLRAADNDVASAQAVLHDRDLLAYFLTQQPDYLPGRGDATADLLTEATINHARDHADPDHPEQSTAWVAADIASQAIHDVAAGKPLPETRLAVAGILGTYLPDVDRALTEGDAGPGVYDHTRNPWPPGVHDGDGWPDFGIELTREDLHAALTAIGGDEKARRLIAQNATAYTSLLIDRGADAEKAWAPGPSHAQGSPFVMTATHTSQLLGFLVDGLSRGNISDAKDIAEQRRKVAELFALPLGYIPTENFLGPGGKLADVLIENAKSAAIDHYVGDGVTLAVDQGNSDWATTRQTLQLQALEAARVHQMLSSEDPWPKDAHGQQVPLAAMTEAQRRSLLQNTGVSSGFTAAGRASITNSSDAYLEPFNQQQ